MSQLSSPPTYANHGTADVNVTAVTTTPIDRIRWGAVLAGLFATLSTLAVLAVLGVAVGASAFEPGDDGRNYGIGAGVWGAISALIAFFVGGWLAARAAAVRGTHNGVLNGAMVWTVAVPLMLYVLMGGIGALFRTGTSAVSTGVQAASNVAGSETSNTPEDRARTAGDKIKGDKIKEDTSRAANQVTAAMKDPDNQKAAAATTAKGAWGTLVSLLLGLGAAAVGGLAGTRDRVALHPETGHADRT